MALTELIKEIERRILERESSEREEVRGHAGDGETAIGETEGIP